MSQSLLQKTLDNIPYTDKSFYISEIIDYRDDKFDFFTKVTPRNQFFKNGIFISAYSIEFIAQTSICNSFKNYLNTSKKFYVSSIENAIFYDLKIALSDIQYFSCGLKEMRQIDKFIFLSGNCLAATLEKEILVSEVDLILSYED